MDFEAATPKVPIQQVWSGARFWHFKQASQADRKVRPDYPFQKGIKGQKLGLGALSTMQPSPSRPSPPPHASGGWPLGQVRPHQPSQQHFKGWLPEPSAIITGETEARGADGRAL